MYKKDFSGLYNLTSIKDIALCYLLVVTNRKIYKALKHSIFNKTTRLTKRKMVKNSLDWKVAVGGLLIISTLTGIALGVGGCLKRKEATEMAAYEQALKGYKPSHEILIGDEINGKVIDTVSEVAELMQVYADINGRTVPVPLRIKTEYVANLNGVSKESGYAVNENRALNY